MSLSTGRWASILLESSRIPINSRHVHAGKVFLGAIGIFSSANRCKIWHRAVMQFDRGGEVAKKEIVQYMNNFGNFKFILNDPLNRRREFIKKRKGANPRPKGRTISKK